MELSHVTLAQRGWTLRRRSDIAAGILALLNAQESAKGSKMEPKREDDPSSRSEAAESVADLFSGKMSVPDAVEKLRTRLLDMSTQNRLLHYRHPKNRCIQIAGQASVNLAFERLYHEGKSLHLRHVPEPPARSYEGKRPDARTHAEKLGISTAFEFPPGGGAGAGKRLTDLQVLQYPGELERHSRKIATEAKSAIEETGSNMLFLIFGFLEFYESEESERPLLAPLMSLPVALVRGEIDKESRIYRYQVQHNGEDVADNQTLREKLRRDFQMSLPEFGDDELPERYYARIERAIKSKRRWKVRRQLTLGFLSFGKLAIWADLDTKKHLGLLRNNLLNTVFSGRSGGQVGSLYAEDYRIDERTEASQVLLYDADSSQHSAIIDALERNNLVIIGPPGTGKSQTITNIIAAAMSRGHKVLFVSEKLAALEVVRRRLDRAGLGQFCLELHSHKTQKKKFLEDIRSRIDTKFPAPSSLNARQTTLTRQRAELARYAQLMGARVGNALGLTVNEVFWAAECRRQRLGALSSEVSATGFPDAREWTYDDVNIRKAQLADLVKLYTEIGGFDPTHPWWGFLPNPLAPSDDETISRLVQSALQDAADANSAAKTAAVLFNLDEQPDATIASATAAVLMTIPALEPGLPTSLLAKLFDRDSDPSGHHSRQVIASLESALFQARTLFESAERRKGCAAKIPLDTAAWVRNVIEDNKVSDVVMHADAGRALDIVSGLNKAIETLAEVISTATAPPGRVTRESLKAFLANTEDAAISRVQQNSIESIAIRSSALLDVSHSLCDALQRLKVVTETFCLPFDGTQRAVADLANAGGLPGLTRGSRVSEEAVTEAAPLEALWFSAMPLSVLSEMRTRLDEEISAARGALERCRVVAERLGLRNQNTSNEISDLVALIDICASAPRELLEHRKPSFGQPQTRDLITRIDQAIAAEAAERLELEKDFYLDAVPQATEIKQAVGALRGKNGFAGRFDREWRKARKLHAGLCKDKRRRSSRDRADELTRLLAFVETTQGFVADERLRSCFGELFDGYNTDVTTLRRLDSWYRSSEAILLERYGLAGNVDLTVLRSDVIRENQARHESLRAEIERLSSLGESSQRILRCERYQISSVYNGPVERALQALSRILGLIDTVIRVFSGYAEPSVSPARALQLMRASVKLQELSMDLALLMRGHEALTDAAGPELTPLLETRGLDWQATLSQVVQDATVVADAASFALAIARGTAPLAAARGLASGILNVESAWAWVGGVPELNSFGSWEEFATAAAEAAMAVRGTLKCLESYCRGDVSLLTFLSAADDQEKAERILESLMRSVEIRDLFGEWFAGSQTDLERIKQVHDWGSAVCGGQIPEALRNNLLSSDAARVMVDARRIFSEIDRGCRGARATLGRLSSYGSFSWDDWQGNIRSAAGRDLPSEIQAKLESASATSVSVLAWSRYVVLRGGAKQLGLERFLEAVEARRIPPSCLVDAFEFAVYQSIGRSIFQAYPLLHRFNGESHDKLRLDYRQLDSEVIGLSGKYFANQISRRSNPPEGQRGATVGDYTELNLLYREISKQKRHIPIRQLVVRAGRALQELKPCFMMGPLSVAQYLAQGALEFDLVVMDEASQLRPEDALGSIARGSQLIVVGDPKQLPPSSYFDRMLDSGDDEDDEAPAAVSGMESILDICQHLFVPVRALRWHYRSQHESLIEFSNFHFYKNLIVFPSPYVARTGLGVKYRYVRNGEYGDRRNVPEARLVADKVVEHMLKRPDESLGVVTLNQTQRELIEDLLDERMKSFEEGARFADRWEAEGWPFFVKNLENVQGDERDVIFVSATFGRARGASVVRQNFGPISRPDGWRRLNVLFTRAKKRLELFTSMSADDIVVEERTPLGTKTLRDYLDFARRGVLVATDEGKRDPDSEFEVSVANVIERLGYKVRPQLGVAGFFIDLAVCNPDREGEYLAGVECDGASYHSGCSVRDRDRIRQEILEGLGWRGRMYRIWSTDWFYNPGSEIARIARFLDERRRLSALDSAGREECEEPDSVACYSGERVGEQDERGGSEDRQGAGDRTDESGEFAGEPVDIFVEIGDRVTYCVVDEPDKRLTVQIVDSESNARMGIINERTPVALALLGLSPGDIGEVVIHGQESRSVKVIKVQRRDHLEE